MSFELICYLNFGYPTIEDGVQYARLYIKGGCEALQVDIPSRNPYLEHQMIQDRMAHCLRLYPDYQTYFDGIGKIRKLFPAVKLVLMLYENIVEELGAPRIIKFCKQNRIEDLTYVGNREDLKQQLMGAGLRIACYVQYHLPDTEIEFAQKSNGIVLLQAQSVGKTRPGCETFADGVRYLRGRGITKPIFASVGIREPEDVVRTRQAGADGAFVGSRFINVQHNEALLLKTILEFKQAATAEREIEP